MGLLSLRSFFLPCSLCMTQTPQADAVPVCIATAMADVSSIEPCHLRVTSARSVSSGAMDAVARMFKTIHLSRRGPMLRADACTTEAWEGHIELVDIVQWVCRPFCS
jgi:hypothetical protein